MGGGGGGESMGSRWESTVSFIFYPYSVSHAFLFHPENFFVVNNRVHNCQDGGVR